MTGTLTEAIAVAGTLLFVAALDAMFAGFRPLAVAAARAAPSCRCPCLTPEAGTGNPARGPVATAIAADAARSDRIEHYSAAGRAMLGVYLPYGLVVLLAIGAYMTLSWRTRFLASALLLGPLTLV